MCGTWDMQRDKAEKAACVAALFPLCGKASGGAGGLNIMGSGK